MKKRQTWILLLALVFILVGCGKKDSGEKIVIYTSMYEDIVDEIDKALEEKFPDIDVEFFSGGTGTLQAKIAAEVDSGQLGFDMLMVAEPSYALELMEDDLLHAYKIEDPEKLAFEYDEEGYWYPVRVLNMVLAYNPDKNAKDQVPNSFKDFAENSEFKDHVSMPNPLTSGSALASTSALRDKYGDEFFKSLGGQNAAVESGSVALTKLESGEADSIMILEESVLKKREEEGSKLEVIYPEDGVISIVSPIMTAKEEVSANKNVKAAEKLTDWFLSEEGQEYIVKGWMHSVLKDYDKVPFDSIPTKEITKGSMPIDWDKTYKEREEIRTMFQEHVTIEEEK